jgi:hypothetical protein
LDFNKIGSWISFHADKESVIDEGASVIRTLIGATQLTYGADTVELELGNQAAKSRTAGAKE